MDCEKSDVSGCPMEPLPSEVPISETALAEEVRVTISQQDETDTDAWRGELSARLTRYRARRKAPPPRYPSLKLPFSPAEPSLPPVQEPAIFESVANHARAFDTVPLETPAMDSAPAEMSTGPQSPVREIAHGGAKIIEFPRFAWAPPSPPADQLAEPVMDRPRILEVPEMAPPPPALGGITIEPVQKEEVTKRPGVDVPLQTASLARRLAATLIDAMIIAVASSLFGFIFWKVTAIHPPGLQFLVMGAAIPCIFWAAYQYLLIVYSASTPGLRLARLELARFNGMPARRSLRRWRVLASFLSAASLGMGYVWVFLDEDSLCWHDRITHTHLAPRKTAATS
jgi:uncharacterized RDD family membrane protein YckC